MTPMFLTHKRYVIMHLHHNVKTTAVQMLYDWFTMYLNHLEM